MTKQNHKKEKIFIIFCFSLTLIFCLVVAEAGARIITTSTFSSQSTFRGQSAYTIYAISLFSSVSKAECIRQGASQQAQNGAGFVWQQADKFFAIASAYSEINDANLVAENLQKEGHAPEIIKISIDEISISSSLTPEEINALVSAVTIYKTTFDNLYDISVALDTKVCTQADAALFVSDVENLISKTKLNLDALFGTNQTSQVLYISLSLNNLYNKLTELKNSASQTNSNQTFSSKIKNTYMSAIELNYSLSKNI